MIDVLIESFSLLYSTVMRRLGHVQLHLIRPYWLLFVSVRNIPSVREMRVPLSFDDTYQQLIDLLDEHGAEYRLIDHPAEGRTDIVSPMRGNEVRDAAKCMIVMVKVGKKVTKYVLAVVPGDARVDLQAIKRLYEGTYVSFASTDVAERLSRSVSGTILPFPFSPELELIADPGLRQSEELFFNAARLDRSVALRRTDYEKIAAPRFETITQQESPEPVKLPEVPVASSASGQDAG
jgi:Ala-tRNA(Pro) deacylase